MVAIHAIALVAFVSYFAGFSSAAITYKVSENSQSTVYTHADDLSLYISMFVVTADGVVAFDPSRSVKFGQDFVQAIRNVTDKPIEYVVYSHNHWDHTIAGQVFREAGASIIAHAEAAAYLKLFPGKVAQPDTTWSGSKHTIYLGDAAIDLHYFGLSHGIGMTVTHLPDHRIAFIADLVAPRTVIFSIVPDFNIIEYEKTLEEILKLDFDTAIYTHSSLPSAYQGGHKNHTKEMLQYIRDIRSELKRLVDSGINPAVAPSLVKLPKYKSWRSYDLWFTNNVFAVYMPSLIGPYPYYLEMAKRKSHHRHRAWHRRFGLGRLFHPLLKWWHGE